jgi:hypothetical protein
MLSGILLNFLRLLLICDLVISAIFLCYSVFLTDACYTVPCLSNDYSVNFLRVSVSASVSAVVFGAVNVLAPMGTTYLMYTRCRPFNGGVLNGVYIVISLTAWIQTITWGEQYSNMVDITPANILMFGSIYKLNTELLRKGLIMFILSFLSALLNSLLCLFLLHMRDIYCVEQQDGQRPQGLAQTNHQYQTVSISETLDRDDDFVFNEIAF